MANFSDDNRNRAYELGIIKNGFKNKIINGDMQVTQRGRMHSLTDDGDYTADRWYSEIQDGSEEVRQEFVYSATAGAWKDETDPFGDGSQHNLWQFDGDATDTNGNNDGTLNGDATFVDDVLPNIGAVKVLTLDGDGDYVSTDFKIGTQTQYTLSAWFKTDDSDMNGKIIANLDSGADYDTIRGRIAIVEGNIELSMGDGNEHEYKSIIPPYNICNNTWHHIVVSIDGYTQTVYINAKKIETVTFSISAGTDSDGAYSIGREGEADQFYFNGQIARTRIFLDKALTEDEIRKLYVEDSKYFFKNHLKSIITQDNDISTYTPFVYRFEGQDIAPYIAKQGKMVLSFDFASNSNRDFTLKLNYPDGSEFKSYTFSYDGDKEFQKITQVIDFSEFDLTKLVVDKNLGLELQIVDDTDVDVADWVSVTDVQLEVGDIATKFERKDKTTETLNSNGVKNQCTAWVSFDGTDGTIRDSFNISSVTRKDTGIYVIEFENSMSSSYLLTGMTGNGNNFLAIDTDSGYNLEKFIVHVRNHDGNLEDSNNVGVSVFGGKEQ